MPTARFWFGPVLDQALDAQLFPVLVALGGLPLRCSGGRVWLGVDAPAFSQWQALEPESAVRPLLWLLPSERHLPAPWPGRLRQTLALERERTPWRQPELAELAGAWASENPDACESWPGLHCWLGFAPDFCRPLPKRWDALILAGPRQRPFWPQAWLDRPGLLWSRPDRSLQLQQLLCQSRLVIGAGAEALPSLLQALAAGGTALSIGPTRRRSALIPPGLWIEDPAADLESLLGQALAAGSKRFAQKEWAYSRVFAKLVDALLELPERAPPAQALAAYARTWDPANPWQRLATAVSEQRWQAAAGIWSACEPDWPLPLSPLPEPLPALMSDSSQLDLYLQVRSLQAGGQRRAARKLLAGAAPIDPDRPSQTAEAILLQLARELAWLDRDSAAAQAYQLALGALGSEDPVNTLWLARLQQLSAVRALGRLQRHRQGLELQLPLLLEQATQTTVEASAAIELEEIWWEGPFATNASLAVINDALTLALGEIAPIRCLPTEPLPENILQPMTLALNQSHGQAGILVSHRYPPRLQGPARTRLVNILPWEFGALPQAWLALQRSSTEIWVPSAAVRSAFWQAGFAPDQVRVVPNGVDTRCFIPGGPRRELATRAGFRFLFVGGVLHRKGVDLLLEAFGRAFGPDDDVSLVIKDFAAKGIYALEPERRRLQAQLSAEGPELVCLSDDALSAAEMAALYRACDVYVHPYRGEGFGMPILEAMACGLPVILTDAGPGPEFCPPAAGWRVRSLPRFLPELESGAGPLLGLPWWHEPDLDQLVQCLRAAWEQRNFLAGRQQAARTAALAYDWQKVAACARTRLEAISLETEVATSGQRKRLAWCGPALPLALDPGWDWVALEQADFRIVPAWQEAAGPGILWWLDRADPRPRPPQALWLTADPSLCAWLLAQGVSPERIGCLPPAWDFARPLPQAPELAEPGKPVFVALLAGAGALPQLMTAWNEAWNTQDPACPLLVLACPETLQEALLDQLDQLVPADAPLMLWPLADSEAHQPDLELLAAASVLWLPDQAHDQPGTSIALWALAAQAAGRRVIANGRWLCLERPWCLSADPDDSGQLAWLLRAALREDKSILSQVRQEMARRHDLSQVRGQLPRAAIRE